jgi:hypothetical protein
VPTRLDRQPIANAIRAQQDIIAKELLGPDSRMLPADRAVIANVTQIPMILPYYVRDPASWWFWCYELRSRYNGPPGSVSVTMQGDIDGDPPPLVTAIVFYPYGREDCIVKEFTFTAETGRVSVSKPFTQTLKRQSGEEQPFILPLALAAQKFTITALSNHGANYTCIPIFELYGLPLRLPAPDSPQG